MQIYKYICNYETLYMKGGISQELREMRLPEFMYNPGLCLRFPRECAEGTALSSSKDSLAEGLAAATGAYANEGFCAVADSVE